MQLIGILQPTQAPQNYDTDNICYLVIIPIIFFCRFYFLEVLLYAFHVPILPLFRFEGKIDFRVEKTGQQHLKFCQKEI